LVYGRSFTLGRRMAQQGMAGMMEKLAPALIRQAVSRVDESLDDER
jgi:hypothetical protein